MQKGSLATKIDYFSSILILILFSIGMCAIASATKAYQGDYSHIKMQLTAFLISIVAVIFVLHIDYSSFKTTALYLYILLIIPLFLLIAIPTLGHSTYGATRWFKVGPVQIQFSEFAKILFILTFAAHIDKIKEKGIDNLNKLLKLIPLFIHLAIPVLLIMKQPDNGTAMVFCFIAAVMLFSAGISKKYIIGFVTGAIIALPLFYFYILPKFPQYVQKRIFVFLNPSLDPQGAGYNALIAKLSVGSGQIWGQGLFKGVQVQMGALPVKESDFIFSVIGEEMGFIWCTFIIIIFTILFMRFIALSKTSHTSYGSLIIIGVTSMMVFHMFQNVGMNIGILPVAGIPLPFISYGGSAILANMIGVGLVFSAGMPRNKLALKRASQDYLVL